MRRPLAAQIPELQAVGAAPEAAKLQWKHANNTLVVSHAKPPAVLQAEQADRNERLQMPVARTPLDDPASMAAAANDCKQQ